MRGEDRLRCDAKVPAAIESGLGVERIIEQPRAAGNPCVLHQLQAVARYGDIVQRVIDEGHATERLPVPAQAQRVREQLLDGRDAGQGTRENIHLACAGRIQQLPDLADVVAGLNLRHFLLAGIVGLSGLLSVVAQPEETRCSIALVDHAGREGPTLLALSPVLELSVKLALHALLDARHHRPLLVLRRIGKDASVSAPPEVGIMLDVGSDDLGDVLLVIRDDPRWQDAERRAAIRVGADQRHGNERSRLRVEPPRQAGPLRRSLHLGWLCGRQLSQHV